MPENHVRIKFYFFIYLFIYVHMISGDKSKRFKFIKDSNLNGFNCPDEHVFQIKGNRSATQCVAICVDSAACFGVFRHQETCVGCKDKYLSKDNAPELHGTIFYKRQSYVLLTDKMSWFDAKNHCAEHGGHLLEIKSEQENVFTKTLVATDVWLGATDLANEGTFVWEDGSEVNDFFTNWDDKEPNNASGDEHCLKLLGSSLKWNDVPCDLNFASVCEFD